MKIHILKTEGPGKRSDRIQIRDENFRLIAYFSLNHPEKELAGCGLSGWKEKIVGIASELPYGKIASLTLNEVE